MPAAVRAQAEFLLWLTRASTSKPGSPTETEGLLRVLRRGKQMANPALRGPFDQSATRRFFEIADSHRRNAKKCLIFNTVQKAGAALDGA
jgi:hypothetical protein